MATEEELNNQQEYNRLKAEASRFEQQEARQSAGRVDYARQLNAELKDQLGIRQRLTDQEKTLRDLSKEVLSIAQMNFTELGNSGKIDKEIAKAKRSQLGLQREIASIQRDLTVEQAQQAQQISNVLANQANKQEQIYDIEEQLKGVKEGTLILDELEVKALENKKKKLEGEKLINEKIVNDLKIKAGLNDKITEKQIHQLATLGSIYNTNSDNVSLMENELETQRKINQAMGVTGSIVTGLGGIMQRLGLRSGIFNDAMQSSKEKMHEMAEETVRGEKNFSKLQIAAAGFRKLLGTVVEALFDPVILLGKLLQTFLEVNKASVTLQQLTGQNAIGIAGLNDRLATSVQFLETAVELTKEFGLSATNVFNKDVIAGAAEFKNILGLAAEEAAGLAKLTQTNAGSIDAQAESIVDTVSSFNKANRSAINQGQILRDVAKTSDDIQASLGNSPALIAKAAAAARRLGMDLAQVDRIASSLMDFESSIQAELEAQLLTGRQINMAKARELALNNDLFGLGKELFKNSVDIHEFGEMNRLEQESMAKALGMSRQELARTAYLRALENGLTEDQAANAAKVRLEDMKRLSVQESIQQSLDKIAQAAAPFLQIVADGVSLLTPILSKVAYMVSWMSRGFEDLGKNIGIIFTKFKPLQNVFKKIKDFIEDSVELMRPLIDKAAEVGEKISKMFKNDKGEKNLAGAAAGLFGSAVKIAGLFALGRKLHKGIKSRKAPKGTPSDPLSVRITRGLTGNQGGIVDRLLGKKYKGGQFMKGGGRAAAGGQRIGGLLKSLGPKLLKGSGILSIATAGMDLVSNLNDASKDPKKGAGSALLRTLDQNKFTALGAAIGSIVPGLGTLVGAGIGGMLDFANSQLLGEKGMFTSPINQQPTPMATGGIVTKPTNALVGEAGSEAVIPLREFYAKMDELINVVKQGGDVYMDGNKVGQSMVLASTKLS